MNVNKIRNVAIQDTSFKANNSQAQKTNIEAPKFNEYSTDYSNAQRALGLSKVSFKGNDNETFKEQYNELKEALNNEKYLKKWEANNILYNTNKENISLALELQKDESFPTCKLADILAYANSENLPLAKELASNMSIWPQEIRTILASTDKDNVEAKQEMHHITEEIENFPKELLREPMHYLGKDNIEVKKEIYETMKGIEDFPKEEMGNILYYTDAFNLPLAKEMCLDKDFPKDQIGLILSACTD